MSQLGVSRTAAGPVVTGALFPFCKGRPVQLRSSEDIVAVGTFAAPVYCFAAFVESRFPRKVVLAVQVFNVVRDLRINFEMRHSGIVGFLRGFVFESFSWSSVELSSDGVAFVLGE